MVPRSASRRRGAAHTPVAADFRSTRVVPSSVWPPQLSPGGSLPSRRAASPPHLQASLSRSAVGLMIVGSKLVRLLTVGQYTLSVDGLAAGRRCAVSDKTFRLDM